MTAYPSWFASPLVQRGVIRALGSDDVVVTVTVRWAPRGRLGRTT